MTAAEYNICVDDWSDGLYRFAVKSIGEQEEAKDAVQQAFETLWIKREEVSPEKAKSFLFTVVHRRCMDVHRYRKRHVSEEAIPRQSTQPDQHQLKQYLQQALNKLDIQSRTLLLLKDYEGYNYEEISIMTKLSLTQVKVYLHRARKTMRSYLTQNQETF